MTKSASPLNAALGSIATLILCGVCTNPASANPAVRLEWIEKDGMPINPPNSQVAVSEADIQAGVVLVLQVSLILDEVLIHEFGFLLTFDNDLRDELDFPVGDFPASPLMYDGPFNAVFFQGSTLDESDDMFNGLIGPYRGCVVGSMCGPGPESYDGTPLGNQTIVLGTVNLIPTVNASNDRRDIVIGDAFNEEFRDANGMRIEFPDIDFGFASVVPEPTSALLDASALLTLAALARARSRCVA